MSLDVSVPCGTCGTPITFGVARCAKCGVVVARDVKAALHARLAASSADYRELQDRISSARTALLVASSMYLVFGVFAFVAAMTSPSTADEDAFARLVLATEALMVAGFLGCWWWARTRPALSLVLAALLWIALQVALALIYPRAVVSGLWLKGVVAILMVRGVVAGVRANAFLGKLEKRA
jgi:Na+/proline symporter